MVVIIRYAKCVLIFCLFWAVAAYAASNAAAAKGMTSAECLACHNDPSLTKDVNGKQVSLYVKEAAFKVSMHGAMFQCTDCHKDVKAFPHEPVPAKVSCGSCHEKALKEYNAGFHAKAIKSGDTLAAACA